MQEGAQEMKEKNWHIISMLDPKQSDHYPKQEEKLQCTVDLKTNQHLFQEKQCCSFAQCNVARCTLSHTFS